MEKFAAIFELVWILSRTDIRIKYRQTFLGPLWYVFTAIVTSGCFTVLFTKVYPQNTDLASSFCFFLSGGLYWNYSSQCFESISYVFTSNRDLFKKVSFPRIVYPLSFLVSRLVGLALQLVVFVIAYGFLVWGRGNHLGWSVLLMPVCVVWGALVAFGAGLCVCSVTVRYRDLLQVITYLEGVWFLSTPILYPSSRISESYRPLMALNPLTSVVEIGRRAILGVGDVSSIMVLISFAATVGLLALGLYLFSSAEKILADYL